MTEEEEEGVGAAADDSGWGGAPDMKDAKKRCCVPAALQKKKVTQSRGITRGVATPSPADVQTHGFRHLDDKQRLQRTFIRHCRQREYGDGAIC